MDRRLLTFACVLVLVTTTLAALAPVATAARPTGVTNVTATPNVISPSDQNGVADAATVTVTATAGQTLFLNVYDATGALRRSGIALTETTPGSYQGAWDGRSSANTIVPESGSPYTLKPTTSANGNAADDALNGVTVDVDNTAPTGVTVSINNGAQFTQSANVNLTIGATAPTTGYQLRVARGPAGTGENINNVPWETFVTSKPFTLSTGDGTKTVRLQVRDAAGNVAPVATATIGLDTIAPTGSIVIAGDAATVTSTSVVLTLTGTDASGISDMRLSNDGVAFPNGYEPFVATKNWVLGGSGLQRVTLELRDRAGRTATFTDTVTVDSGLSGQAVSIAAGATYSTSPDGSVTLTLTNPNQGTYTQMAFSNDGTVWSAFEPFSNSKSWVLANPSVDGIKTVHFRLYNPGNPTETARVVTDSIIRDTTVPTATTSLQDAAGLSITSTTANGARLSINGADANGLGGARASRTTGGLAAAAFAAVPAGAIVWCFVDDNPLAPPVARTDVASCPAAADGTHTIHVQTRDNANLVSASVSRSVTRDTTPPAFTSFTPALTNGRVAGTSLHYAIVAGADATHVAFAFNDGALGTWQPFAATGTIALPAGLAEGSHTVSARVRDAAGNPSSAIGQTFVLDKTGPIVSSFEVLAGGSPLTAGGQTSLSSVQLRLAATDGAGVTAIRAWLAPHAEPSTSSPYTPGSTFDLAIPSLGTHTIHVRLLDALGNPSAIQQFSIVRIQGSTQQPPPGGDIPVCTATFSVPSITNSRTVTLTFAGATVSGIAVAEGSAPTTATSPISGATSTFTLDDRQGAHVLFVKAQVSGVICDLGSKTVVLDSVAPVTTAPADVSEWRRNGFDLQLSVTDAHSAPGTTRWSLDGGPEQVGTLVSIPAGISEGIHTLTFRTTDGAGNVETLRSVQVRIDRTPPTTTTDQPDGLVTPNAFSLVLVPTDSASGVAFVRYRIDATSGSFSTLQTSPFTLTLSPTLGSGTHTVQFAAVDHAGNEEALRTFTWTFGSLADLPLPPLPLPPAPGTSETAVARPTPGVNTTIELPGATGVVGATIVGPVGATVREVTLSVRVLEPAEAGPFRGAPVFAYLDISLADATGAPLTGVPVNVRFNLSRAWLANQSFGTEHVLLLHQKGGAWEPYRTRVVAQDPAALGFAGNITFEATVTSFSPFALAADAAKPTFSDPTPANGATVESATRVSIKASDNVRIATSSLLVDGVDAGAKLENGVLSADVKLAPGKHTVVARVTDLVGNANETTWSFTVAAPVVPTPASPTTLQANGVVRAILGPGAKVDVSSVTVDNVPVPADKVTLTEDGFSIDPSAYGKGKHTLRATYTDADGTQRTYSGEFEGTQSEPRARGGMIWVLLIALVVVGVAAALYMRKKKR